MTPLHVRGQPGDLAPYVLLPGDPGRARWIAETFLDAPRLYNEYRSLLGYTGTYQGMPVSVQTTGMGTPSASIVAEELIQLGAQVLVRVGTCGAMHPSLRAGDLFVAQGSIPADGVSRQYLKGRPYTAIPDYGVLEAQVAAARQQHLRHHVGLILTEDAFYATTPADGEEWARLGAYAVEMEASAIFLIARMRGIRAGALLTVSNQVGDAEFVAPQVLQTGVENMTRVALEGLLRLHRQEV